MGEGGGRGDGSLSCSLFHFGKLAGILLHGWKLEFCSAYKTATILER